MGCKPTHKNTLRVRLETLKVSNWTPSARLMPRSTSTHTGHPCLPGLDAGLQPRNPRSCNTTRPTPLQRRDESTHAPAIRNKPTPRACVCRPENCSWERARVQRMAASAEHRRTTKSISYLTMSQHNGRETSQNDSRQNRAAPQPRGDHRRSANLLLGPRHHPALKAKAK